MTGRCVFCGVEVHEAGDTGLGLCEDCNQSGRGGRDVRADGSGQAAEAGIETRSRGDRVTIDYRDFGHQECSVTGEVRFRVPSEYDRELAAVIIAAGEALYRVMYNRSVHRQREDEWYEAGYQAQLRGACPA
jgi:hypothetical protein